ncbi:MAG TPA: hypothetical protein VGF90_04450 [Verrucomicrobiae bacterium]
MSARRLTFFAVAVLVSLSLVPARDWSAKELLVGEIKKQERQLRKLEIKRTIDRDEGNSQ